MKDILELVIKNLVKNQDEVSINETEQNGSLKYEVKVSKEDMGRVIGKKGKIAQSVRTLIRAIAGKEDKKVIVEFVD